MTEQPNFSNGVQKGIGFRDSFRSILNSGRDKLKSGYDFVSKYWPEIALIGVAGVVGGRFLLESFAQNPVDNEPDQPLIDPQQNIDVGMDPAILTVITNQNIELMGLLGVNYSSSDVINIYSKLIEGNPDSDGDGIDYVRELAMGRSPLYNEELYKEFVTSKYHVSQDEFYKYMTDSSYDFGGNGMPTLLEFLLKKDENGLLWDSDGGLPDYVENRLGMNPNDSVDNFQFHENEIIFNSEGLKGTILENSKDEILLDLNRELNTSLHRLGSEYPHLEEDDVKKLMTQFLEMKLKLIENNITRE